jgi:hypothetical protein
MPNTSKLEKAELQELDKNGQPTGDKSHWVKVQFNPETLKVSYSNAVVPPATPSKDSPKAGDQRGNPAIQFVGKGTTKLSVQLWFDVTALDASGSGTSGVGGGAGGGAPVDDVQQITQKVVYFITPIQDRTDPTKYNPPSVSFVWGTFKFDGIMESLEQSLEYFDPNGKPLRASISINLARQDIVSTYKAGKGGQGGSSGASTPGTKAMTPAKSGDTLQGLASGMGQGDNWQAIAEANSIENPRQLSPGQLIDMSARAGTGLKQS